MATKEQTAGAGGARVKVQQFGRALSGMVMPNIGAFIAWGLITALFIPTGWIPDEYLGKLVDPMIKYLLPLLIGYTGGNMVHGKRGAVTAAIVTMGVIVGSDIPMFLGAMIVGPLSAWIIKQFDKLVDGKIKSGFEMLVNNFSIGILGGRRHGGRRAAIHAGAARAVAREPGGAERNQRLAAEAGAGTPASPGRPPGGRSSLRRPIGALRRPWPNTPASTPSIRSIKRCWRIMRS